MALRMVALRRTKTGLVARKGIPVDGREPYARLYGVGWGAKLKLPADISKHEAKARHGEWLADVEMRIAALLRMPLPRPAAARTSTQKTPTRPLTLVSSINHPVARGCPGKPLGSAGRLPRQAGPSSPSATNSSQI